MRIKNCEFSFARIFPKRLNNGVSLGVKATPKIPQKLKESANT
jgi:hypothetical protein